MWGLLVAHVLHSCMAVTKDRISHIGNYSDVFTIDRVHSTGQFGEYHEPREFARTGNDQPRAIATMETGRLHGD
jgi:hypothetical protein